MKKFNKFISESIRDKMIPKSDEEVKIASVTTTLKTYPKTNNKEELTECVNLLLEYGYVYYDINIEDKGEYHSKERIKDDTWFRYIDPVHYVSLTDDTKLSELKDRLNRYKKRYNL